MHHNHHSLFSVCLFMMMSYTYFWIQCIMSCRLEHNYTQPTTICQHVFEFKFVLTWLEFKCNFIDLFERVVDGLQICRSCWDRLDLDEQLNRSLIKSENSLLVTVIYIYDYVSLEIPECAGQFTTEEICIFVWCDVMWYLRRTRPSLNYYYYHFAQQTGSVALQSHCHKISISVSFKKS